MGFHLGDGGLGPHQVGVGGEVAHAVDARGDAALFWGFGV